MKKKDIQKYDFDYPASGCSMRCINHWCLV